ncbi:MAG: biotin/lipoyl-containing protein [Dehalococcoidia bacterium]
MATRHRFQVGDNTYTVMLDESGGRVTVAIDDASPQEVDVTVSGIPGVFSILRDGVPTRAYVVREGRNLRVVVDGRSFVLGAAGAGRGRGAAGGAGDPPGKILAPLAGVAVEIRVAVGDRIEARQGVVVIEAMKMQNEVQAPHPGVVTAVHAQHGVRVEKGELLVEYTPDEA